MRALIVLLCCLVWLTVNAQQEHRPWEDWLREVVTREDAGEAEWEDMYEMLCELEQHPMDINKVTREELEQLPFLSAQQVEEIQEYLYRYGPMKSKGELAMIRSLDYSQRQLLTYFIYISDNPDNPKLPDIGRIVRYGKSELMVTGRIPFYKRRGDEGAYLGYPYRHWLRYQFSSGDAVKLGMVASQDAGEPFFANRNKVGYDYYSLFFQLKNLGRIQTLVAGRYRAQMGMGLVMNSNFTLGKMAILQNLGRSTNALRAHSSRTEASYLQGAGATISLGKGFTLTAFGSYRAMDATLGKDGSAVTIITSGYHRTETEMEKKHNLKNTTTGGSLRYDRHGLHMGVNTVYTHLNRRLTPNTNILYRQHYAQGSDFTNASIDYGYVTHRLALNGETALNGNGAIATINSVSLQLGNGLSLMALQRFYSYRYTALYARSFSDGGNTQNESGLYLGLNWQPSPRLKVMAYTDYAYAPWAKYQVSLSSHAWDHMLQVSYHQKGWTLGGRYRLRRRQRDNEEQTALIPRNEHRMRLTLDYDGMLASRTQVDLSYIDFKEGERGWMVSQTLGFEHRWLRLNGGVGYFQTDGYDSRVYLYEQGPLYTYAMSQFQGHGLRAWLMMRAAIGPRLSLTGKLGHTRYFDRDVIGSSYQQVDGSSLTDLDLQVRWKF